MRKDHNRSLITLALAVTLLVTLGAGSEAAAARQKSYDRIGAPRPRPMAGPSSGEPDQTNGAPAPPKVDRMGRQYVGSGQGGLMFHQWMMVWARTYLKRS